MQRRKLARLGMTAAVIGSAVAGVAVYKAGALPATPPSSLVAITPCRLVDTRAAAPVGGRNTPLANQETATFTVWGTNGNCNIPNTALGIVTNTTIVNPTSASYLTMWPADDPQPLASNLNWTPTSPPTPNQVSVGLSADGKVKVFNNAGTVDLIVDIVGYLVPQSAGPKGDRGVSAYDAVPTNTTLTGEEIWQIYATAATNVRFSVRFPAKAYGDLDDAHVSMAPSAAANDADENAACTGTFDNPTAPSGGFLGAGNVCVYVQNASNVTAGSMRATQLDGLQDSGFRLIWDVQASGTTGVNVSWAYRSPQGLIIVFPGQEHTDENGHDVPPPADLPVTDLEG